ncbi:PE domain-containing protein [Nocardia cyriacigeorgica]|nr:PE domain-containing protein [Nocardia cyriacigeorgica]
MTLPLQVSSSAMRSTGASYEVDQAAFEAALSIAAPATIAMPAALDPVSKMVSARFNTYAGSLLKEVGDGSLKRRDGGEVLAPVATAYTDSDIAGGGTVSAYGSVSALR